MKKFRLLALLTVGLLAALTCWAQSTNQGSLVGRLTDPNEGVIPGVDITITNNETTATRKTTTNEHGDFRVDFLQPGKYAVFAERAGFKKTGVSEVTVQIGQVQRVDLVLFLGDLSETVTVPSSDLSLINTESATIGEVIDSNKIENLPLNGREFLQLAALVPGAESGNPKRGAVYSYGLSVGFNGARAGYNSYNIDGADSTDADTNQLITSPVLDAIREFRVETNMYSAQYGRSGGAVINVVTKSGTNDFHGSLFLYHRNKWLDAAPVLDQRPYEQRAPYLFNQFGASIGGPVVVPAFGEGGPALRFLRNKTFFFFSAEAFRQKQPAQVFVSFAPTAKERIGDLSDTRNPYTGQRVVLRNPFTGAIIPSNIVPQSLINPVGKRLMELWPEPNFADPFLNLRTIRSGVSNTDKWGARIDHQFSTTDSLSVTFNYANYDNVRVGNIVYGDLSDISYDRTLGINYTHIFNNRVVNDFKFSHTWYKAGTDFYLNDKNYAKEWGLFIESPLSEMKGSPRIVLYGRGNVVFQIGASAPNLRDNRNLYIKDSLVWVKNSHTISIGGDFKRQAYDWFFGFTGAGSAYAIGQNDGAPGAGPTRDSLATGSTFASLLMGVTASLTTGLQQRFNQLRRNMFSVFVQDDWKVTPRLTLNLGIRYDNEAPFSEISNRFATLDFDTGKLVYAAGAPDLELLKYKYQTNGPNRPYETRNLNFSPRAGFALRPFNKPHTAIRGGYGIFFTTETAYTTVYGTTVGPFGGQFLYRPKAAFLREARDHFVTIDQKPYRYDDFKGASPGSASFTAPYYPTGYLQQWNLAVARDLGKNFALELAYVGSKGTNLNGTTNTDLYSDDLGTKIRNPVDGIPGFNPGIRIKGFNSSYNSFQAKLTKRLSNGLSFLASFTWGHALAESSNDQVVQTVIGVDEEIGNFTTRRNANADFDVRKRLSLSGLYQLPFGNGRAFGNRWSTVPNALLGGWSLNYILTLQDGYPFSVYDAARRFADRICDGKLPKSERTHDRWIDIACFPTHVPQFGIRPDGTRIQLGNHGNSGANIITGPGTNNLDLGLHKEFHIYETRRIQLRLEAFNALNHPNFTGPNGNEFTNTVSGVRLTRTLNNRNIQVAIKFLF